MAIAFDAVTDMLSRTTGLPPITSFTVMCWARLLVDRDTYQALISLGDPTGGYYIGTSADGVTLYLYQGVDNFGPAFTLNTWTHVAVTVSGTGAGQFLGYINGALVVTADGTPTGIATTLSFCNDESSEWWNGSLAAGKVWSVPLTADEIKQEMRYYLPIRTADINGVYPWLTITNQTTDYSGQGNTLTLSGTLTTATGGPPIAWAPRRLMPFDRAPIVAPTKAPPPRRQAWRVVRRVA